MNVLFVYTIRDFCTLNKPFFELEQIPFGISYISSVLKANGHNTDVVVMTPKTRISVLGRFIKQLNPCAILFSPTTSEYASLKTIAKYIKNKNQGPKMVAKRKSNYRS